MKLRAKRETEVGYYDGIPGAKPIELATLEPGEDIFINLDDFKEIYQCSQCGEDIVDENKKPDGAFKLQHKSCPQPEKLQEISLLPDAFDSWEQQVNRDRRKINELVKAVNQLVKERV